MLDDDVRFDRTPLVGVLWTPDGDHYDSITSRVGVDRKLAALFGARYNSKLGWDTRILHRNAPLFMEHSDFWGRYERFGFEKIKNILAQAKSSCIAVEDLVADRLRVDMNDDSWDYYRFIPIHEPEDPIPRGYQLKFDDEGYLIAEDLIAPPEDLIYYLGFNANASREGYVEAKYSAAAAEQVANLFGAKSVGRRGAPSYTLEEVQAILDKEGIIADADFLVHNGKLDFDRRVCLYRDWRQFLTFERDSNSLDKEKFKLKLNMNKNPEAGIGTSLYGCFLADS